MNKWYSLSLVVLIVAGGIMLASVSQADEQNGANQSEPKLESIEARASYAIGVSIGRDIKQQELGLDPEIISRGIRDALKDENVLMSDEQLQEALLAMRQQAMETQQRRLQEIGQKNLEEGQAFLEENKLEDGVKVTESGLQYEVIEEGDGPIPGPADHVVAHYEGTFIDGEVFDSSYERGQPLTLPVNGVIEGWSEALQMMRVGSKWRLFVPADLAYEEQGPGPIGPNRTLIFEVELQSIVEDPAEGEAQPAPARPAQPAQPQQP